MKKKPLEIEIWHVSHDAKERISGVIPQIGAHINLDENSEFAQLSGERINDKGEVMGFEFEFVVVMVEFWLNNKGYNDECAVIVRNLTPEEKKWDHLKPKKSNS